MNSIRRRPGCDGAPSWPAWRWASRVVATSAYGRAVIQFVLDSRVELRKIVWPNRRESMTTTAVVFGFVILGGGFFWLVDLILAWATRHLTGQGG